MKRTTWASLNINENLWPGACVEYSMNSCVSGAVESNDFLDQQLLQVNTQGYTINNHF